MTTTEERAHALERAQSNAAHAASEFVETYEPDEDEETVTVSRAALDDLKAAVEEWNAASNAFLGGVHVATQQPGEDPIAMLDRVLGGKTERRPIEDGRNDQEI